MTLHRNPAPGDAAGITVNLPGPRHGRIVYQTATSADRTTFFFYEVLRKLPGSDENPVSTSDIADYYHLDKRQRVGLLSSGMERLARRGLVEKAAKQEGIRYLHWRRTRLGDEHVASKAALADQRLVMLAASAGVSGTDGAQT